MVETEPENVPCRDAEMPAEMPLMFGQKIGKQKICISAINGPFLPLKPLENRCRAFCCAELPLLVTPVWGKKGK